jgi:hypothetical protein
MNEGVRVDAAVNGLRLTGIEFDARTLRVIAEAAAIRPNSLSTASNLISGNAPRPRGIIALAGLDRFSCQLAVLLF